MIFTALNIFMLIFNIKCYFKNIDPSNHHENLNTNRTICFKSLDKKYFII